METEIQSAIATLVKRATRYVILLEDKEADNFKKFYKKSI